MEKIQQLQSETIADFGKQWEQHPESGDGYYGSQSLFEDVLYPFLKPSELKGSTVADIGSGTGRIVMMIARSGAEQIVSIEPSSAFKLLKENTKEFADRITYVNASGENLPTNRQLDYVLSIGVVHHIPDPAPVLKAAYAALKPGGKILLWLYGKEGNELYLLFVQPLRKLVRNLPSWLLNVVCWSLWVPMRFYISLCRWVKLPMQHYMVNVIGKTPPSVQKLIIHDQLCPAWAKYYTKSEALDSLRTTGFVAVDAYHRHGYSWTVVGTKPTLG